MSRVLFLYERDMPTVSITRTQFINLSFKYNFNVGFQYITEITPKNIDETDILVLIRPNDVLSWRIAKKACAAGCTVAVLCDDDLLNLPADTATVPWRKAGLKRTLQNAHAVISSSQYIREKYICLTIDKRKVRIDTVVTPEEVQRARELLKRPKKDSVKIVYAGAPSHVALFDRYIRPVIPELIARYGKGISFTFVGVRPDLSEFEEKTDITYVNGMPLAEYRKYMSEQNFDVGLAPLNNDNFSKCKYFNKFLEYSLQGVVGVYSNLEPYTYVVRHQENGFLTDNGADNWLNALEEAIDDQQQRQCCLGNALNLLEQKFTEEQIFAQLLEDLPELHCYKKSGSPCKGWGVGKLIYWLSRPFDLMYLSWFQLSTSGVNGFIQKIKTHLRERNAYKRK